MRGEERVECYNNEKQADREERDPSGESHFEAEKRSIRV